MNYIISIILAYRGEFFERTGLIFGYFNDANEAAEAMEAIAARGFAVARWGNQITVER
jgi:hypothetical protein